MKRHSLLLPLMCLILTVGACASTPTRMVIGVGNQAPLQDLFQKWFLIDDRQPLREVTGTIEDVHLNRGKPFADGDWNIVVKPDPELRALLVNRAARANSDGAIELEIRSAWPEQGLDLAAAFPPGTRVRAFGWWVEDSGHASKTELHPLISLQTTEPPLTAFIGQDLTGRFAVALDALDQELALPVVPVPALRDLTSGAVDPGAALTLDETAQGDFQSDLAPGGRALSVHLARVDQALRASGLLPYYLGRFTPEGLPAFTDQVAVARRASPEGRVSLQVTVTATLGPGFTRQAWAVDGREQEPGPLSVVLTYAPGQGSPGHAWTISGWGSTDYEVVSPGRRTRALAFAQARYSFEPSEVALTASRSTDGYSVRAVVKKAHSSLSYRLLWQVSSKGVVRATGSGDTLQVPGGSAQDPLVVSVFGETDIGEQLHAELALPVQ